MNLKSIFGAKNSILCVRPSHRPPIPGSRLLLSDPLLKNKIISENVEVKMSKFEVSCQFQVASYKKRKELKGTSHKFKVLKAQIIVQILYRPSYLFPKWSKINHS